MSACDPLRRHRPRGDAAAALRPRPGVLPARARRARRSRALRRPDEPREGRLRAARGGRALGRAVAAVADGHGHAPRALIAARVRKLGLDRARHASFRHETDREALAAAYRAARCVVMPGELETFGLVAFEAAASGAAVVACETAPSARVIGDARRDASRPATSTACSPRSNAPARREPDRLAAARFATANRWETRLRRRARRPRGAGGRMTARRRASAPPTAAPRAVARDRGRACRARTARLARRAARGRCTTSSPRRFGAAR